MLFNASVRHSGEVAIVDVSGRIVLGEGSKQLTNKVTELLNQGHRKILLNLAETTYVDSSGLGELVSCYSSLANAGGKMKLLNVQPKIAELLRMTRLHSLFESFANEADAVASFQENRKAASA